MRGITKLYYNKLIKTNLLLYHPVGLISQNKYIHYSDLLWTCWTTRLTT